MTVESHTHLLQRFYNFWSSVSKLSVGKNVPRSIQEAIVRGMNKAYREEPQGREE